MKTTSLKILIASVLLAGAGLAQAAPISIYSHTISNPNDGSFQGVKNSGGTVTGIRTTYNETEQTFSWSYDVAPAQSDKASVDGDINDGFWLVVSDGPDPKYDQDEYTILFGDLDTKRLTAYLYSGQNNSNSWNDPGVLLESYDAGAIVVTPAAPGSDSMTVSFDIDVADLNTYSPNPDPDGVVRDSFGEPWDADQWDGVSFAESLGIWFHPTTNTVIEYNNQGEITKFSPQRYGAGYYDGKDIVVSQVPEPNVLYLAGIGLIGFAASRKLTGSRRRKIWGCEASATRLAVSV